MERKDFLKKLGLGALALSLFPKSLISKTKSETLNTVKEPIPPVFSEQELKDCSESSVSASQPYIITIYNNSIKDRNNIQLFNAKDSIKKENYGLPSGIVIKTHMVTMSYEQFLQKIIDSPFIVGLIYLQSSNSSQVLQPIAHKQDFRNGQSSYYDIVPFLDPFQHQSGTCALKTKHNLDENTTFILSTLKASTELIIYLYPSESKHNPKPIIKSSDYIMSA